LEKQNDKKPEVAPTPAPIVREIEEKEVAPKQETAKEPVFVPTPVVTPEPEPQPEVVEEKEVTRAEKFEVIEEQKDVVVLKKYHVVIGSFGNKDNALRLQAQMRPQYEPIIVRNDKGMYRVLLMTYDTYKEAKTKILEVRNQFPDAWVLVMQNS
jgi:cell division protein FtsN